jgi:hypothetical protein
MYVSIAAVVFTLGFLVQEASRAYVQDYCIHELSRQDFHTYCTTTSGCRPATIPKDSRRPLGRDTTVRSRNNINNNNIDAGVGHRIDQHPRKTRNTLPEANHNRATPTTTMDSRRSTQDEAVKPPRTI